MRDNNSIKQLFEELFDGDPWLDINIITTLQNINAVKASTRTSPFPNSIWEIVNHIIDWRLNVLKRVKGKVLKTPNTNYFKKVTNTSQQDWEETIERLKDSQSQWIKFLKEVDPNTFSNVYLNNGMTYYQHIHGIIQHDAYHLGQIVLLAKHG